MSKAADSSNLQSAGRARSRALRCGPLLIRVSKTEEPSGVEQQDQSRATEAGSVRPHCAPVQATSRSHDSSKAPASSAAATLTTLPMKRRAKRQPALTHQERRLHPCAEQGDDGIRATAGPACVIFQTAGAQVPSAAEGNHCSKPVRTTRA